MVTTILGICKPHFILGFQCHPVKTLPLFISIFWSITFLTFFLTIWTCIWSSFNFISFVSQHLVFRITFLLSLFYWCIYIYLPHGLRNIFKIPFLCLPCECVQMPHHAHKGQKTTFGILLSYHHLNPGKPTQVKVIRLSGKSLPLLSHLANSDIFYLNSGGFSILYIAFLIWCMRAHMKSLLFENHLFPSCLIWSY